MGYSIYVACPDKATMEEMYQFLLKNYRAFTCRMDETRYHDEGRGRKEPGGLDYVDKSVKFPVGFDYNCMGGPERIYMWAVVEWMALTLLPDNPEYWYDIEEKFVVKESPIDVEHLRGKLKKDPFMICTRKADISDFAEEMYWDLRCLDVAWKARSGVADPADFWEAIEAEIEWWDIYQEDKEADSPVPYAEEMREFFVHAPLKEVKKWILLAKDICPDEEAIGHWLDQLIGEAADPHKYRLHPDHRVERRRAALLTFLDKERGEEY